MNTSIKEMPMILKRNFYDAQEMNSYRQKGFQVKKVKFYMDHNHSKMENTDSFIINKPLVPTEVELEK